MFARLRIALVALALPALLPTPAAAEDAGWPRTIAHEAGALTLDAPPRRVVSTSPSLTGILIAIDAPLVASSAAMLGPLTDDKGFFLQWAEIADARGVEMLYPNLAFDIEAVIMQDPDLVVASSVGGDAILPYVGELSAQGIPVLVLDYATHGWEDLAAELGRATGREAEAAQVARDFAARAAEVAPTLTRPPGGISIVSYNFAGTYAVSRSISPQARVLSALGFEIAEIPPGMEGLVKRTGDFDFVSRENLPAAITGESVFLLNGDDQAVRTFAADPVLANLPAVRQGQVFPLGPTSFRVDYYSGLEIIETARRIFGE